MFEKFIEHNRALMVESLQTLLRIPSVRGPETAEFPFGWGVASALDYVLQLGQQFGLATENSGGYAGHVEYGEGDDYVAVLSHLDVVPDGAGWTYPPFGAEIHDGKVYARGAVDDKGPALSTLWALIAIKSLGVTPKRKIRLIFGLDEESEWRCVANYFRSHRAPLGGFTPDADFPLIYAEKGVCTLRLTVKADSDSLNPQVVQCVGGSRDNMVPDYACAVVDCHSETAAQEWEQRILRESRNRQIEAEVKLDASRVQIVVHGLAAHASIPDKGVNALVLLASLLAGQPVSNGSMWRFIAGQDTCGRALGIDCADDVTGPLTANLGVGMLENGEYTFDFNVRYPVDMNLDVLLNRCRKYVPDRWSIEVVQHLAPLYVPPDSPVVKTLSDVYRQFTGENPVPLAIGGATYARAIPNAVAFGPLFPGQADCAHQPDEHWELENYFRCIQIYAHAMIELANTL